MSTRGNVVFLDDYVVKERQLHDNLKNLKLYHVLRYANYHNIYVHSDMYPSGALYDLQEYLQLDGAKARATHTDYLAAWFVGWKCLDMSKWTRRMGNRDFQVENCKNPSLKNLKESKDFFGIGLQCELNDWCNYTYVILAHQPEEHSKKYESNFDIYIYEGDSYEYPIAIVNSEDDLTQYEEETWWY